MTANRFDLTGQVALVTGGNSGIGRAIAVALAEHGASIAIAARDMARSEGVRAEIEAAGGRATTIACDVAETSQVDAAVAATVAAFGRVTVLVNNAGMLVLGKPETLDDNDWERVMNVNFQSAVRASRACLPHFRANGGGKIINVASVYSFIGSNSNVPYAASKGAIMQLTRSLADSWAKHNVQVNAIAPGVIDTPIWGDILEQEAFKARIERRTPAGRLGTPEDCAGAAVFLASPAADFVTGQILATDGGFLAADAISR